MTITAMESVAGKLKSTSRKLDIVTKTLANIKDVNSMIHDITGTQRDLTVATSDLVNILYWVMHITDKVITAAESTQLPHISIGTIKSFK